MSKSRAYLTLIDIAKRNAGVIDLSSPEVTAFLAPSTDAPKGRGYRLPSYIWDIKHYASMDVKADRVGRTIVRYILPAFVPVIAVEANDAGTHDVVAQDASADTGELGGYVRGVDPAQDALQDEFCQMIVEDVESGRRVETL